MKKLALATLLLSLCLFHSLNAKPMSEKNIIPEAFRAYVTDAGQLPAEEFDWGTLKWLCSGALSPGSLQTVGIAEIRPGKRNTVHYHPNCEEVLYVLSGKGRHSFDERAVDLEPGMTIRIPSGVKHNLANTGSEQLVVLISFSSGDRKTVFLKDEKAE